jgi:hypothetical protein
VDVHFGQMTAAAAEAIGSYRQGDVLEDLAAVVAVGPRGETVEVPAPLGVVVVSQTCDVVLPNRLSVQLARRVRLGDREASEARDGKRPRYAYLPQIGETDFADLDVIMTVAKRHISGLRRRPGVLTDEEVRRFARALARKYGRFPFPDNVTPWLRPLEEVVSSRVRRPNSPEGRVLDDVVELRVESARGWDSALLELTLCVIVKPGVLPTFPNDEMPDLQADLHSWLYGRTGERGKGSAEIANRLLSSTDPAERYWLWMALGEAWAIRCRPPANSSPTVLAAVSDIAAEVISADEFPLTRVRRTEILDLDHLSSPIPDLSGIFIRRAQAGAGVPPSTSSGGPPGAANHPDKFRGDLRSRARLIFASAMKAYRRFVPRGRR